jgi:hypothetical protein
MSFLISILELIVFAHSFSPLPLGLYVTSPLSPYSVSRALFGALSRYLLNALRFGLVMFQSFEAPLSEVYKFESKKMKLSLIFIQLAAAFVTERRCIALKLKCSGGNSRFEYNSLCMGPRPGHNWTMTINKVTQGNIVVIYTACRIRLVDGIHHVTSEVS